MEEMERHTDIRGLDIEIKRETAKHQLEGAEKRVMKNNAVTDQEKREKKIVVKKLAEMEEELKVGEFCEKTSKLKMKLFSCWLSLRT